MFVLDEADEMLSRGFKDQIYDIFQLLPPKLQVSQSLWHGLADTQAGSCSCSGSVCSHWSGFGLGCSSARLSLQCQRMFASRYWHFARSHERC